MTRKLFADWPKPVPACEQGARQVSWVARCACGRTAEWRQISQAAASRLDVLCDCRADDQ